MILYIFIQQAFCLIEHFIKLKNSNLHLAVYRNAEFQLVEKDKVDSSYYDHVKIQKENKYVALKFGNIYLNSFNGNLIVKDTKPLVGDRTKIVDLKSCKMISNEHNMCITKGENQSGSWSVSFKPCDQMKNQCFIIEGVDKESEESKEAKKEIKKEKEARKAREQEEVKDYDLRYVHDDLDEAHHFLADEDSDEIISRKHYVPECFYGYDDINLFLNDPLPNLRKLKTKYCMWNERNRRRQ